ncbi:N-6 DNA methylase [Chryseolinea sp. H1M3-3]|uniref:N-6 DNA methylase n=1 Tax=Chryseolinea sp. H1M3-3 TaxID=3034144 RepID=UPI0023EA7BD4|nr:N-6 DNA methylase [Chryseolinea sp. H1M3-3]
MKEYSNFTDSLDDFLKSFKSGNNESWRSQACKLVDGLASEELRRLVSIEARRDFGAFFTESALAEKVLRHSKFRLSRGSFCYDPACGAGNLLIAIVNVINQTKFKFSITDKVYGTDIHNEFVNATRLRLAINHLLRNDSEFDNAQLHRQICVADGLINNKFYEQATHVFVNPPYNVADANESLTWSKGKVSQAAVFMDKIIEFISPGTAITAILPDVLRSGSRYEKWRAIVNKTCRIEGLELLGQFDKYADVDVFAINLVKRKKALSLSVPTLLEQGANVEPEIMESSFDVCVGPVVDNRDPRKGQSLGYLVSKKLKDWSEINSLNLKRRHSGRSFKSPFVVIKRTSRLGDRHRAAAVIVNVPDPIYVDNHLIVVKPKSGRLNDCKQLLKILKDNRTNNWLNQQIRCRHLTVKILSKLPLWR